MGFLRYDKSFYDSLSTVDRWPAAAVANMMINASKEIENDFDKPYWYKEANELYFYFVGKLFLEWHDENKLKFYGPSGQFGPELVEPKDYMNCDGHVNSFEVFFLKIEVMPLIEEYDKKVYKRLKKLLDGKFWKEPKSGFEEKDLVQILTKRIIGVEEDNERDLPSRDSIIRELNMVGVGTEAGKSTLYDWIGEVYPQTV